jgi:hypothetical protein
MAAQQLEQEESRAAAVASRRDDAEAGKKRLWDMMSKENIRELGRRNNERKQQSLSDEQGVGLGEVAMVHACLRYNSSLQFSSKVHSYGRRRCEFLWDVGNPACAHCLMVISSPSSNFCAQTFPTLLFRGPGPGLVTC